MRRTAAAVIPIISLFMCCSSNRGNIEDATKAYNQGDYKTAYRLIKPLAEQGLPKAQFDLGAMYDYGEGVSQDYAEAAKWYRKAAEQGNAPAQTNLGMMYEDGRGIPQDYTEAARWYRKAADQGWPTGQGFLGVLYTFGTGVPKNDVLAHMWISHAISGLPPTSEVRKSMRKIRKIISLMMTPAQIAEAQKLAREWKPKMDN